MLTIHYHHHSIIAFQGQHSEVFHRDHNLIAEEPVPPSKNGAAGGVPVAPAMVVVNGPTPSSLAPPPAPQITLVPVVCKVNKPGATAERYSQSLDPASALFSWNALDVWTERALTEPGNLTSKRYALAGDQIFDGVEKKILSNGETWSEKVPIDVSKGMKEVGFAKMRPSTTGGDDDDYDDSDDENMRKQIEVGSDGRQKIVLENTKMSIPVGTAQEMTHYLQTSPQNRKFLALPTAAVEDSLVDTEGSSAQFLDRHNLNSHSRGLEGYDEPSVSVVQGGMHSRTIGASGLEIDMLGE